MGDSLSLLQKFLRASFRQGFWAGIQALRSLDPGWKHAGVTEFETFARVIHVPSGHPETMKRTEPSGQFATCDSQLFVTGSA